MALVYSVEDKEEEDPAAMTSGFFGPATVWGLVII